MSIERNKNLLVIPVNGSPESKLKDYKEKLKLDEEKEMRVIQ